MLVKFRHKNDKMDNKDSIKRLINSKLSSTAGESLAETLVSLLISALALVMLAGVITASTRIVSNSRDKLNRYYDSNEKLALMNDADGKAGTISIKNEGTVVATNDILYFENDEFSKNKVVAYRINE